MIRSAVPVGAAGLILVWKEGFIMKWIVFYLAAVNVFGFVQMGIDKERARRHAWRISESQLFGAALLGGSIGSILGMYYFRHKTKHWYFVWGMPVILILQIGIAVAWYVW